MPSLPARQIQAEGNDGTKFTATIGIDVLGDGTFSIELPPELEVIAKKLKVPNAHVGYARMGAKARVYATELNAGIRLIRDAAEDYLRAEEVTERVICYTACINVSFWEEPDKQVAPNGCGRKGQWWSSKLHGQQFDACHRLDSFDVGIAAKVFDKITTKRTSGDTVRYVQVEREGHDLTDDPAQLLNGWTTLDVNAERARQMPYTPEAALFFNDLLKTLCTMARSLDSFIGDEKKLKLAIAQRTQLLLT